MTASNLIPALCQNCGGKLNVDPGLDSLTCQYCDTEHIIRRNVAGTISLEAFARCPLCRRNDQSEKVSAILNKQTSQSNGYMPQQEVYTDDKGRVQSRTVDVRIHTTNETNLAQKLAPPRVPESPKSGCLWPILLFVLPLLYGAIYYFHDIYNTLKYQITVYMKQIPGDILYGSLCLLGAIGLVVLWVFLEKSDKKQRNIQKAEYEISFKAWKQSINRWENLYYCGRDDVVFIPGEKTSANVSDMVEYVYAFPQKV